MNNRVRISVDEARKKYDTITDDQIDVMRNDTHCMNRLIENMSNEYKSGLDRDAKKVRQFYLNRTPEQKRKYYKYVCKGRKRNEF